MARRADAARGEVDRSPDRIFDCLDERRAADAGRHRHLHPVGQRDRSAQHFARRLLSPAIPARVQARVQAWLATDPLTNPNAPGTPFVMPEYQVAETTEATRLNGVAQVESTRASDSLEHDRQHEVVSSLEGINRSSWTRLGRRRSGESPRWSPLLGQSGMTKGVPGAFGFVSGSVASHAFERGLELGPESLAIELCERSVARFGRFDPLGEGGDVDLRQLPASRRGSRRFDPGRGRPRPVQRQLASPSGSTGTSSTQWRPPLPRAGSWRSDRCDATVARRPPSVR